MTTHALSKFHMRSRFLIMRAEAQSTEIGEAKGSQAQRQARGQAHHLIQTDNKNFSPSQQGKTLFMNENRAKYQIGKSFT